MLQVFQVCLMAVPANLELGTKKTLGPRDPEALGGTLASQLSPRTARLHRAMNNHFEGLILLTIAVTVVTLSGQSTAFTAACAWIYLAARVVYIPCYVFGLSPWRSVAWFVGFAATTLMLIAAVL
nr:MAPEG family protein [Pseudoruegeria sp. HB172150]